MNKQSYLFRGTENDIPNAIWPINWYIHKIFSGQIAVPKQKLNPKYETNELKNNILLLSANITAKAINKK